MPKLFYFTVYYSRGDKFLDCRILFCIYTKGEKIFSVISQGGAKSETLFPTPMVNTWFETSPIKVKQLADEGYWKAQSNSHVV